MAPLIVVATWPEATNTVPEDATRLRTVLVLAPSGVAREVDDVPSLEVNTMPFSPTSAYPEPDQAMENRSSRQNRPQSERLVHASPSGEVAMIPKVPTATNWLFPK